MPITQRQVELLTQRLLLKGLRSGKHPAPSALARDITAFLDGRPDSGPIMKIRKQARKRQWDVESQNQVLEEVDLDLQVLYQEVRDLTISLLRRHNFTDVAFVSQARQLDLVIGELDNMLFAAKNTDDRFFGAFDSFRDLSKVDLDLSTEGVVDLSEGVALLPAGALSTRKIPLTHLFEAGSWGTTVKTAGELVSNRVMEDGSFGNAFHDLLSVWRQRVVTSTGGPTSIEFTFPVSGIATQEVTITRIQLISHSAQPMSATVFTSTDNVNFLKLPQGSDFPIPRADEQYNIDFPAKRIQYLRIVLTLHEADDVTQQGHVYNFGVKHIGLFAIGRIIQAEMVSKAIRPTDMEGSIRKVVLDTSENIPQQCNVQWFVQALDSNEAEISTWRPIAPLGRQIPELPSVVQFGNEVKEVYNLSGAGATLYSTYKNHQLYELAGSVLPAGETSLSVVSDSARLLRGIGAWSRNRRTEKETRLMRDAYVSFATGPRKSIWAAVTESASSNDRYYDVLDETVTYLTVAHDIDHDSSTAPIKPDEDTDPTQDPTPRYAVHAIRWYRSEMSFTDVDMTLTPYAKFDFPRIITSGTDAPVIKDSTGAITYTDGEDYQIFFDKTTNHATIAWLAGGTKAIKATYKLDPDITQLVEVATGKTIILNTALNPGPDETFEVVYRFAPKDALVKQTIKVTEKYGPDGGKVYKEGPDYSIDTQRGTITRIPSGEISEFGAVYMDFYYESVSSLLETFTIWGFVENREPQKFDFTALGLDTEAGEQFYIRAGADTVELTRMTESPALTYGWHQIVVRSADPDTSNDAAIRKVAQITDRAGEPVFIGGGKYFTRLLATRVPMKQVDSNYLLTNLLPAERGNFALTTAGEVLVNFNPGTPDDLWTYGLRLTAGSYVFAERDEEFELEYLRKVTTQNETYKLRVKAILSRAAAADGGLTPKIRRYRLRIG